MFCRPQHYVSYGLFKQNLLHQPLKHQVPSLPESVISITGREIIDCTCWMKSKAEGTPIHRCIPRLPTNNLHTHYRSLANSSTHVSVLGLGMLDLGMLDLGVLGLDVLGLGVLGFGFMNWLWVCESLW